MFKQGNFEILKNKMLLKNATISGVNIILILLALNLLSINFAIVESSFMRIATIYLLIGVIIFNLPFKKLLDVFKRKKSEKTSFYKTIVGSPLILFSFALLLFFFHIIHLLQASCQVLTGTLCIFLAVYCHLLWAIVLK